MISILQYNAGNTTSVQNALNRLGCESIVTADKAVIQQSDKVIFPGVGEAASAMAFLRKNDFSRLILQLSQPFLGICLGLQLMCQHSEEGDTDCLGIFDTMVKRFPPKENVPHVGWNNFETLGGALFREVDKNDDVYYVHSYFAATCAQTVATCDYIVPFSAALAKDNFYATQFHPEKSADVGSAILQNFLSL